MNHDTSYCAETVRRLDVNRYVAALFAPEPARGDLFALYAFNLALATVREQVNEPLVGLMRFQWWRETIDDLYRGGSRDTPVARALKVAIERHRPTRALFDTLIEARERDVGDPPAGLAETIAYAEATGGSLATLAVEILGAAEAREAAHHGGVGWALTGLARAGLVPSTLIESVAEEARRRIATARALPVPRAALPALAQLAVADRYLARRREPSRIGAQLRIAANALRGRF